MFCCFFQEVFAISKYLIQGKCGPLEPAVFKINTFHFHPLHAPCFLSTCFKVSHSLSKSLLQAKPGKPFLFKPFNWKPDRNISLPWHKPWFSFWKKVLWRLPLPWEPIREPCAMIEPLTMREGNPSLHENPSPWEKNNFAPIPSTLIGVRRRKKAPWNPRKGKCLLKTHCERTQCARTLNPWTKRIFYAR